jgi:hypothetical protein
MNLRNNGYSLALLAAAGVAACGEKSGSAKAKNPEIALGAPNVRWEAKNHEQRMGYMAAMVEPRMKKLFVEYDKTYQSFGCQTCHGNDMELVDYEMPTNGIYALPVKNTIAEARDYDEEATEFMLTKVLPELKALLNAGQGPEEEVSCFSCHPKE